MGPLLCELDSLYNRTKVQTSSGQKNLPNRYLAALKAPARLFFVRSGNVNGGSLNNRASNGNYWSSQANSSTNAYNLNFNSSNINSANNNNRNNGFSVRCVAR